MWRNNVFRARVTRRFAKPHFENPRLPSTCLHSVPIVQNFACIIVYCKYFSSFCFLISNCHFHIHLHMLFCKKSAKQKMACRACAEEARASGGVGSRVALNFGKNEEQLPQPTVGPMLADCRLPPFTKIFCQQSADCWPTVVYHLLRKSSANSRPTVGRLSFTTFYENLLPTVGRLLAVCRLTVGRLLAACW